MSSPGIERDQERPTSPFGLRWAVGLFLACLAANIVLSAIGWNNSACDSTPGSTFRQTQTALTAAFMQGHYRVEYETPVLGPPWAIPYEFPLYQWFVAGLADLTGWSIDPCGRLVSRVFFLLTLVPFYRMLAHIGVRAEGRLVVLSLFLISPYFVFWSRTVLIESTALFLSVCYLNAVLAFRRHCRVGSLLAGLALGTLAALVKVTTLAGFSLLVLLPVVEIVRSKQADGREVRRRLLGYVLLLAVPAAAAVLWTQFTDAIKAQNPFGQHLTSTALRNWNYGTWQQRLGPRTWGTILDRVRLAVPHVALPIVGGGLVGFILLLATCIGVACATGRFLMPILGCFAAYLGPPLVFTNLHWFHEYYSFATNAFLIAASGLAVAALLQVGGSLRRIAICSVGWALVWAAIQYADYYYPLQAHSLDDHLPACRIVREQTAPEDVILVLGTDWSSVVPYYAQRRALALPDSWPGVSAARLADYIEPLRPYRLRALVIVSPGDYHSWLPRIDVALARLQLRRVACYSDGDHEVYRLVPIGDDK